MFGSKRGRTVIGNGLKIVGNVTAEGLIEVNGEIEGDLYCTSLIVSPKAQIVGSITAEQVVVNGKVEGPIQGGDVVLRSQAHVTGDIHHRGRNGRAHRPVQRAVAEIRKLVGISDRERPTGLGE